MNKQDDVKKPGGRTEREKDIAYIVHRVAGLIEVRVMARAEGYAMVRRPNAVPFIVKEAELREPPTESAEAEG